MTRPRKEHRHAPRSMLPYSQESVPSHGHVLPELFHLVRFLGSVSPFPFDRRRNETPLPGLLQLVAVFVEVMVHLPLLCQA